MNPHTGPRANTKKIKARKPHTNTLQGNHKAQRWINDLEIGQVIHQRMAGGRWTADLLTVTMKALGRRAAGSQSCEATTVSRDLGEWRKHTVTQPKVERRCRRVILREDSAEEGVAPLRKGTGWKKGREARHGRQRKLNIISKRQPRSDVYGEMQNSNMERNAWEQKTLFSRCPTSFVPFWEEMKTP